MVQRITLEQTSNWQGGADLRSSEVMFSLDWMSSQREERGERRGYTAGSVWRPLASYLQFLLDGFVGLFGSFKVKCRITFSSNFFLLKGRLDEK